MENPLNQVNEAFRERLKNPFMGSFILAFIAFNWKAIFFTLFSQKDVETKLNLVNDYSDCYSLIIYPFSLALIYVLILPYIGAIFERITVKAMILRENNAQEKRKRSLRYELALARETRELNEIRTGNRQSEELQEEIKNLKSALDSKESEIVSYSQRIDEMTQERVSAVGQLTEQLSKLEADKRRLDEEKEELRAKIEQNSYLESSLNNELSIKTDEIEGLKRTANNLRNKIKELESKPETVPSSIIQLIKNRLLELEGEKGLVQFRNFAQSKNDRRAWPITSNYLALFKQLFLVYEQGKRNAQLTPLGEQLYRDLINEGI